MIYNVDSSDSSTNLTFDSKYMDNDLKLNNETLKDLSNNNSILSIKYKFKRVNPETENEMLYIVGSCMLDDCEIEYEELLSAEELGLATKDCYFKRVTLDESSYIKNCKNIIKCKICEYILKEKGVLTKNSNFECIGCISSLNKRIAFFEKLEIIENNEVNIYCLISVVNILNVANMKIEAFINKKWKVCLSINSIYKKDDHYVLNVNNIDKIEITEIPIELKNIKYKSEYSCEEEFIKSRKDLINDDLLEDNYNLDEFDDIF